MVDAATNIMIARVRWHNRHLSLNPLSVRQFCTRFLTIKGNGPNAQVFISKAWFVGQPNFLRAWAITHSMACQQSDPLVANLLPWKLISASKYEPALPVKSKDGESLHDRTTKGDEEYESESGDGGTKIATQIPTLVETAIEEVEIIRTLGYGHDGVVLLANWRGTKVALKQFDVGKDGFEYFNSEVEAYLKLQNAWGVLVPMPLFVSQSWSGWIKFIS